MYRIIEEAAAEDCKLSDSQSHRKAVRLPNARRRCRVHGPIGSRASQLSSKPPKNSKLLDIQARNPSNSLKIYEKPLENERKTKKTHGNPHTSVTPLSIFGLLDALDTADPGWHACACGFIRSKSRSREPLDLKITSFDAFSTRFHTFSHEKVGLFHGFQVCLSHIYLISLII